MHCLLADEECLLFFVYAYTPEMFACWQSAACLIMCPILALSSG